MAANYSKKLNGYNVPFFSQYKGQKSSLYQSSSEACLSGWNDIKSSAYNGLLLDSVATYRDGVCEVTKDSIKVATLVVHNTLNSNKGSQVHLIIQPNGHTSAYRYNSNQRNWKGIYPGMTSLSSVEGNWIHHAPGGLVENYSAEGLLLRSEDEKGYTITFTYDKDSKLQAVSGPFGDTLTYHYDESDHLRAITTPDGDLEYNYDTADRLVSVTYPDNRTRQYHYEDSRFPNHLTGITDENGDRYATWAYDAEGRAILSEHA